MSYNLKQFVKLLLTTTLFWSLAFSIFVIIRYYALGAEEGLDEGVISIFELISLGSIKGVVVGIFYSIVEFLFDKYMTKNIALGLILLLKSIIYLLLLIFSSTFLLTIAEYQIDVNLTNEAGWWKTSKLFWIIVGYFTIVSSIFQIIKIANEKFSKGKFFSLLIGKYKKPIEVERIFMFIDLQSSTAIAEQLGHFKYSQLIQDCFNDLNRVVNRYNAEIYQYVGDEAVLTWPLKTGLKNTNCISVFYAFSNRLNKKQNYYLKNYTLKPVFKAGIHGGKLIATEVGTIKKEIAYHGDVINTTSRIQELCNTYKKQVLISKELALKIDFKGKYTTELIGDLKLKGKEESLKIEAIIEV
ncbi:adenylate/guanylate cyclase domain-containing protein [Lacinutrix salivirga]